MSKSNTRRLKELREGYGDVFAMSDKPNVLITVDQEKYEPFLIERVTLEGFDIAKYIAEIPKELRDHELLLSYQPVRHLLTSMAIFKPFRLTTPSGEYGFDKITMGKATRLRPSSFSPFRPHQESSAFLGYRPYRKSAPPVSGQELRKIVDALEPYVFLLALIGGALGLCEPQVFGAATKAAGTQVVRTGGNQAGGDQAGGNQAGGNQAGGNQAGTQPDRTIGSVLATLAVVSALVLYSPTLIDTFSLRSAIGTRKKQEEGTLLARMKNLEDALGSVDDPKAGTFLGRTKNLEDALGSANDRQAGTLLARIDQLDSPASGTLLARMKNLETLLERLCQSCEDRLAREA